MIRNVIFDWSGTLVDDLPAVWRATNEVFRRAGVAELTVSQFRAEFCLPFTRFYSRYTPHVTPERLESWFRAAFQNDAVAVDPLPRAREFLEACAARGVRSFVLSSVHPELFEAQARRAGFSGFFEHACVGVIDKREEIGRLVHERGLGASETLFVGDMQHDVEAARAGGVWSCAVLTGYNGLDQLRASRPDLIVEHLGELTDKLNRSGWEMPADVPAGRSVGESLPVATVGALIFDAAGRMLMVQTQKWSDRWGIPGGKIRYEESSIDALRREILEETALRVTDIRFVLVQDCIRSPEFYRDAHFILLNYTCRVDGSTEVRLNGEAREYRWVVLSEALALPLNVPTQRLIEAVNCGTAAPA